VTVSFGGGRLVIGLGATNDVALVRLVASRSWWSPMGSAPRDGHSLGGGMAGRTARTPRDPPDKRAHMWAAQRDGSPAHCSISFMINQPYRTPILRLGDDCMPTTYRFGWQGCCCRRSPTSKGPQHAMGSWSASQSSWRDVMSRELRSTSCTAPAASSVPSGPHLPIRLERTR